MWLQPALAGAAEITTNADGVGDSRSGADVL